MLPNSGSRAAARPPRRWTTLAVGGLLSAGVAATGLTWAVADDNPFRRPEARDRERPPMPPEGERPPMPPRDGDRERPDGANRPGYPGRFAPIDPREIREIMEKIENAARDGKTDEVRELVGKLRRMMPPTPPFPPRDGDRGPGDRGSGDRGPGPRDGERPEGRPPFPPGVPPRDGDRGPGERPEGRPGDRGPGDRERGERPDGRPGPRDGDRPEGRLPPGMPPREGDRGPGPRPRDGERPPAGPRDGDRGPEGRGGERPMSDRAGQPPLGMAVAPVPELLAAQLGLDEGVGLVVAEVRPGSPAAEAGIKRFDVITRIGDGDVGRNAPRLHDQLAKTAGEAVEMTVIRRGTKITILVTVDAERAIDRGTQGGEHPPARD